MVRFFSLVFDENYCRRFTFSSSSLLVLLLLPHHFTLFLHLNAIFWNSRTLFSFAILFAPPPPFSHISPFLSVSLVYKRNELQLFWICVCIDLHTDIPLFHWFCLHAFQLHRQTHRLVHHPVLIIIVIVRTCTYTKCYQPHVLPKCIRTHT